MLLFDEPVNGLDAEGIRWIRNLLKQLAAEGRTVFLSSHLMSEMELTADRLIVIGRGRLIAETSVAELIDTNSQAVTLVRAPRASRLRSALARMGAAVELDATGGWRVTGPGTAAIGELADAEGIALHELSPLRSSLEDAYSSLTDTSVEYRATAPGHSPAAPSATDHEEDLR